MTVEKDFFVIVFPGFCLFVCLFWFGLGLVGVLVFGWFFFGGGALIPSLNIIIPGVFVYCSQIK